MHRRGVAVTGLVVAAAMLAACAPVTVFSAPDGSTRTLRWADYPGNAGIDADAVRGVSDLGDLESHAVQLSDAIRDVVEEESGIVLRRADLTDPYSETFSNGYGGDSEYVTFSLPTLTAEAVPAEYATWVRIHQRVSELAEDAGVGPLVLEQDQPGFRGDPEQQARFAEWWATTVDGEYSMLSAFSMTEAQSLHLVIEDPTRRLDATAEETAVGPSIRVEYSAVVIPDDRRAYFEEAIAPFEGAPKPDSTEWD